MMKTLMLLVVAEIMCFILSFVALNHIEKLLEEDRQEKVKKEFLKMKERRCSNE